MLLVRHYACAAPSLCLLCDRFLRFPTTVRSDLPMTLRILVVEDHAPFRQLLCAALQRRAEFQIFEAADGVEAVQKAQGLQPDLILLDIHLPRMNGFEVARRVRALSPSARLLFISQESSSDIVRKALSLGADGYIQKLSAGTDLLPAIDAVLAGQRFLSRSVASAEPTNAPSPRRHELLFCPDDASVVDALARFVAGALNAGDGAIVGVAAPLRTHLLHALRKQVVDIERAAERGTLLTLDTDVAFDRGEFIAGLTRVRAAAVRAGKASPRVACCGDTAGRLWAAGRTAEAVQLEQFGNELPPDVDVLCTYLVPDTNDPALTRIRAEHTAVCAS